MICDPPSFLWSHCRDYYQIQVWFFVLPLSFQVTLQQFFIIQSLWSTETLSMSLARSKNPYLDYATVYCTPALIWYLFCSFCWSLDDRSHTVWHLNELTIIPNSGKLYFLPCQSSVLFSQCLLFNFVFMNFHLNDGRNLILFFFHVPEDLSSHSCFPLLCYDL